MEKSWKRIIPIDHSDSSSSDDSQDHLNSVWKHSLMSSKRVKMTTRLDGQGTSTSPPGFSAVLVSAYPNPSDVLMHHDYVGTSRSGLNSTNQTHDSAPQIRNIDNVPYLFYKLRDFYRGRHSSYLNNQTPANTTSWFDGDNREHVLNTQELTSLAVASLPGDIQYSITSTPHLPNSENRSSDENQDTNTSENTDNNRNLQPPAPLPPPAITDEAESLPRESVLISPVKLEEQVSSCTTSENASTSNTITEQSDTPEKETKSTNTTIEKEEIDKNRETVAESKPILNKDERDGSLNEMLLGLLECPVCWEVMPPPIYQCSRGHLLCRPCRKRLSTCPTCRATLNSSRNLAMEKVAEKLKYPCKNNGSGCSVMVVLREKREHEANCPHRLFTCLSPFCAPRWTCKLDTLVLHYENMHSEMLRRGPKHTLHIPVTHDFYRKLTSHVWVILAFEKLFMVSLRVVPPGEVFGCVQYVGPHSVSRKFIYELKTQLPLDIYRCVRFERTTHSDQSNIDRHYLKKDCFHLSDNWTKNFKSDDIPRSMDYLEIFVSVRPA